MNSFAMYVGNPNRPNTIWVPGHYENGCWKDGYYMKFMCPQIRREQLVWMQPENGKGHWMPANYIIVNACNCSASHAIIR